MIFLGGKKFYSATKLAELKLTGLPKTKRKINERAADELWALKVDAAGLPLARRRQARGGGLEYHMQLLPIAAQTELARRGLAGVAGVTAGLPNRPPAHGEQIWAWLESQSAKVKGEAARRADALAAVEALERSGLTRSAAVACVAADRSIAASTLWAWFELVKGIAASERLPHLAPRRSGGGAEAEVDDGAWQFLKSDYLRPEQPTWSSCYWRMVRDYAEPRGLAVPHEKTLRRKLEREVDGRLIVARREGAEALRRMLPPQQRSVADFHALELVNIDGHQFDVFVRMPDGRVIRPTLIAIADVYSRKFLAWRHAESESAIEARLTFAQLFQKWGIPKGLLADNGRAFASKWLTGGAKTRFRFKIKDEEPTGILTALGVTIHWATPYRGQSKPIERGFRDFCDHIARHHAFAGAYTGNAPDAKPENYGSRAIDLATFKAVVDRGIAHHNSKPKRRTETARGLHSFDQVFEASYAISPIGKASPEQLRMALLTADEVSTNRQTGAVTLFGNRYWSAELGALAGTKVTVRFDPDDLTLPIHVYSRDGRFISTVPVLEQIGFLDAAAAKQRQRQESDHRKAVRRAAELEQLLSPDQLAAMIPDYADEAEVPAPSVIRPVRHRGATAAALKSVPEPLSEAPKAHVIDRFAVAAENRRLRLVEE